MRNFIAMSVVVVAVAGCGQAPVGTIPTKPELTPDVELVAWKDGPAEKFKGKVFRVKAYPDTDKPIKSLLKKCPFYFFTDKPRSQVQFNVAFPDGMDVPNADKNDRLILEFKSEDGKLDSGNIVISLSRSP